MRRLPYIRHSSKYLGKFEVVFDYNQIVPCYNLATARSIVTNFKKERNQC